MILVSKAMQKPASSRWRKPVLRLFFIVLAVSLGVNLHSYFVVQTSMQAASNNKDNRAFEEWTSLIGFIAYLLDKANTNFEVEDAWTLSRTTEGVSRIFTSSLESAGGSVKNLSSEITYAMVWLTESTNAMYSGNQTGSVALRELEPAILVKIENLTANIRAIVTSTNIGFLHKNFGSLSQWLEENNLINLLIDRCEEIRAIGQEIYGYYFG